MCPVLKNLDQIVKDLRRFNINYISQDSIVDASLHNGEVYLLASFNMYDVYVHLRK